MRGSITRNLCMAALLCMESHTQTNVFLRASAPQAQVVIGATNATPVVLQTYAPHGFSNSCNTTTNPCYCNPTAVLTGTGASPVNGVRECVPTDSTHLAVYDLAGSPVAGNGAWSGNGSIYPNVGPSAQFVGLLTKYTIPANPGPLGYLGGSNSDLMHSLSTGTANGLTSISLAGCPSACIITEAVSYNPLTMIIPVAAGQHFSENGTGTALDTTGDGSSASGPQTAYTVATVSSSGWTSAPFACASCTNTNYTNVNMTCGPSATPNDLIGGTQSCTRTSFIGVTTNALWNYLLTRMVNDHTSAYPDYLSVYDGGSMIPGNDIQDYYAQAALRFSVDPTKQLWLDEMAYSCNNDQYTSGTGYAFNSGSFVAQSNSFYNYTLDMEGMTITCGVLAHSPEGSYWTASEYASFKDRMFSDIDDPTGFVASTANQDAANQSTHNWVLSNTGLSLQSGTDATHAQLPPGDPHFGTVNYYDGTVIYAEIGNTNDYTSNQYALITGQTSAGLLTHTGWFNGSGNAGFTPSLENITSATYVSGLTCSGTTGQTVALDVGGLGGFLIFQLTGTNALAGGTPVYKINSVGTYPSPPTSATVNTNYGSAVCTGTATISTTLGTLYEIFDTVTTNNTGAGSATITWTKTASLGSSINVGDGIFGNNGWGSNFTPSPSLVTAVGTNSATVTNPGSSPFTSTTPKMAWRQPKWVPGDSGRLAATKTQHSPSLGVQPAVYGPGADSLTLQGAGYPHDDILNGAGANQNAWPIFELAFSEDPRAVRDLGRSQGSLFDFGIPREMQSTGGGYDGPGYSIDQNTPTANMFLWGLTQSIPNFPNLNATTGAWAQNSLLWAMFATCPDADLGALWICGFGGNSGGGGMGLYERDGLTGQGLVFSFATSHAPMSPMTGYLRGWMDYWGGFYGRGVIDQRLSPSVLHNDPRVPSNSGFTGLPLQYNFNIAEPNIAALTGHPALYRSDAIISRSRGWTDQNGSLLMYDTPTNSCNGCVYNGPHSGGVSLWATGCLLGSDEPTCNESWVYDGSTVGDAIAFNGGGLSNFLVPNAPTNLGNAPITLFYSDSAGSLGPQWGDAASNFVAGCSDVSANYDQTALNIILDRASVCFVHQKKLGNDEFVFVHHDVALNASSPTASLPIKWNAQYPQNGATQASMGGSFTTGSTTYLGGNKVKELEDGLGGGGAHSAPSHSHGLLSYFTSPNPIFVNDDCVGIGGGQCNGASYPGGQGFSHRISINGGASVGANVSKLQTVVVHKVMQTLTDTTFTTFDLNPDANWTGVGCTGANSTGIALFALGGTKGAPTSFSTSFSGAADWAIVGINPGCYAVTVAGVSVGSPLCTIAGSNTVAFSTTGGGGTVAFNSISGGPYMQGVTISGGTKK